MHNMKNKVTVKKEGCIISREYGGAHIARCGGKTASCTSRAREAVERVAMKCCGFETDHNKPGFVPFEQTGIKLKRSCYPRTWLMEWKGEL